MGQGERLSAGGELNLGLGDTIFLSNLYFATLKILHSSVLLLLLLLLFFFFFDMLEGLGPCTVVVFVGFQFVITNFNVKFKGMKIERGKMPSFTSNLKVSTIDLW